MQDINPIQVGRNAPVGTPTVATNPLQEQLAQVQAQAPVVSAHAAPAAPVAPVQAPVVAPTADVEAAPVAQTTSVQQAGGCQMYFRITPVTKILLEMPWGFINAEYDCAFISNMGELVVSDLPPMYDSTNDVFVLDMTAKSIVLGRVDGQYMQYWRESVSFRPDSGYSEEDVKELKETVTEQVQETPEETKPVLEDNTDYSHLSRNQRKKVKQKKLQAGANLEDLPKLLRDA